MTITSHMQNIIQIYPCLLKLSRNQESVTTDGQTDRWTATITISPHHYRGGIIMIITSHVQNIIQIYPCLLKLSRKQDTILNIGDFSTKN